MICGSSLAAEAHEVDSEANILSQYYVGAHQFGGGVRVSGECHNHTHWIANNS